MHTNIYACLFFLVLNPILIGLKALKILAVGNTKVLID